VRAALGHVTGQSHDIAVVEAHAVENGAQVVGTYRRTKREYIGLFAFFLKH
jgi:hypothetical protein